MWVCVLHVTCIMYDVGCVWDLYYERCVCMRKCIVHYVGAAQWVRMQTWYCVVYCVDLKTKDQRDVCCVHRDLKAKHSKMHCGTIRHERHSTEAKDARMRWRLLGQSRTTQIQNSLIRQERSPPERLTSLLFVFLFVWKFKKNNDLKQTNVRR